MVLPAAAPVADWDQHLTRHLPPVLHLVQALKRAAPDAAVPLWLVTAGAQPVAGSQVAPDQAMLWGLGYVLAEEHHELWGGLIDCDPAAAPPAAAQLLLRHLADQAVGDRIALRGSRRPTLRQIAPVDGSSNGSSDSGCVRSQERPSAIASRWSPPPTSSSSKSAIGPIAC